MKIRNPETGEIFDIGEVFDILELSRIAFENCAYIRAEANRKELSVFDYIYTYPHESARLMGYEVLEDDHIPQVEKKEANMDKPLKDWTLGELQEWCYQYRKAHTDKPCEQSCPIYQRGICRCEWVYEWDLDEKPRFTEQDIDDAKMVRAVFGKNGTIKRYDRATTEPYSTLVFNNIYINETMFPSIKEGQEYSIDEIIESEAQP